MAGTMTEDEAFCLLFDFIGGIVFGWFMALIIGG